MGSDRWSADLPCHGVQSSAIVGECAPGGGCLGQGGSGRVRVHQQDHWQDRGFTPCGMIRVLSHASGFHE